MPLYSYSLQKPVSWVARIEKAWDFKYCLKMCLDLKNTEQIFEGNEARFFISKLISSILLKMDFCKDAKRTRMDYLFPIGNKKKSMLISALRGRCPYFWESFLISWCLQRGICRLFIVIFVARFSVIIIIVIVSSNV